MTKELENQMDVFYREMELRCYYVLNALMHNIFSLQATYSARHSYFDSEGERISPDYPLPYIEVRRYCEFQVEEDALSCFTILKAADASVLESAEFRRSQFDVWGEEGYTELLYRFGQAASLTEALAASDEKRLIVHFRLPADLDADSIYGFAKLLRKRGFFI